MRIEDLRTERRGRTVRCVATVIWEDSDRPRRDIYLAVDEAHADTLVTGPDAFVVGCIIPAMRHGERRVRISEPIGPELRRGLSISMTTLLTWYGEPRQLVQIEAANGKRRPLERTAPHAASFLSGGVDSLACLRGNRQDYPSDHPYTIKDCLVVHGFDIGGREELGPEADHFDRTLEALLPIALDAHVNLIPVDTNIRHLDDDVTFWMYEFHGAALAATAHAVSRRINRVYIPGTIEAPKLEPWGSHPALDPHYSTVDLQVVHEGLTLSRLDKVRLISDWDVALRNLRVCTMNPTEGLNCGQCEKCMRTMLELLACDRLDRTTSFTQRDLTADQILQIPVDLDFPAVWYEEVLASLVERGRHDLTRAIEIQMRSYEQLKRRKREEDWRGVVKRLDRRFLSGALVRSYQGTRRLMGRSRSPV